MIDRETAAGNVCFHGDVRRRLVFARYIPVKRIPEERRDVFVVPGNGDFVHGISTAEYFRGVFGFQLPVEDVLFLGVDDDRPLVESIHVRPARDVVSCGGNSCHAVYQ